ncbi:hypothetical protein RV18_GL001810 [Enterococcus termitis]|nr:hypothetical protein RV18_GL001810 [Enterococcus termitis]
MGQKEKLSSIYTIFLCGIKDLEIDGLSVGSYVNVSGVSEFF